MAGRISSMVVAPTEPDIAAAMVQAVVNPKELTQNDEEQSYRILPNTFVFTKKIANAMAATMPPAKRMRDEKERFPQVVGGAYTNNLPVSVLGVAYDGIPDPGAAKHWPNERGRLAVQVSGTCTIVAAKDDLDNLEILDRIEIDRSKTPINGVAAVTNYNIPHIRRFDESLNEKRLQFLKDYDTADEDTLKRLLVGAGYNEVEFTKAGEDASGEIRWMVQRDCRPLGVLLEKGFESARILLTPS
jgi:hypothetical protein